jgi:hypothetical protein
MLGTMDAEDDEGGTLICADFSDRSKPPDRWIEAYGSGLGSAQIGGD